MTANYCVCFSEYKSNLSPPLFLSFLYSDSFLSTHSLIHTCPYLVLSETHLMKTIFTQQTIRCAFMEPHSKHVKQNHMEKINTH